MILVPAAGSDNRHIDARLLIWLPDFTPFDLVDKRPGQVRTRLQTKFHSALASFRSSKKAAPR
jgi:hypothetical protein